MSMEITKENITRVKEMANTITGEVGSYWVEYGTNEKCSVPFDEKNKHYIIVNQWALIAGNTIEPVDAE